MSQTIDLSKLNLEQLSLVKQQLEQEVQHFTQSLQSLNIVKDKFNDCIDDIKMISGSEMENTPLLVPLSNSLYVPGKVRDSQKFLVDIGTGYFVEKTSAEALLFYQKKIDKLNKESVQITNIVKEKQTAALSIDSRIRQVAMAANASQQSQPQGA
ncbi:subunit of tubulin prefoldin [Hanseniaspora osmophila]|uniref:Prefoldin subunit 5 n=1 Tax=Hanseniaspora osmophila TaxID=56408 RepID=A0A1E5RYQ3_9ASCO|nr:Prefoldin subunit 5 [Hanseniaspora osmophila]